MATRKRPATLQEVARNAGVSVSTASRVLNSADFAKKGTRESVIKAAMRIGYKRLRHRDPIDPVLGAVDRQQDEAALKNIVLFAPKHLLDNLGSPDWIFRDIVPTLYRTSRENGFQLVLSSYGNDDQWDALKSATENVGGIIWMPYAESRQREDLLSYVARFAPVVVVNDDSYWPPRTCVVVNNRAVLFKAVEHLVELGHRRIAYFDADDGDVDTHCRERLEAYHQAVVHFGLDTNPALCVLERFGMTEHPQAVARAMDRLDAIAPLPTATIAPLGYAIQFLKETRLRSISVPGDMSIMAIDNAHAAELVDPPLTVIDCGYHKCAEAAVKLIMEQIQAPEPVIKTVLLDPTLVVRGSTAPPRNAN